MHQRIAAPKDWGCVDFVSDLHLADSDGANARAWSRWLLDSSAQALFVLGDLFEVWVGDDAALTPGPACDAAAALRDAALHRPVHFMHGNRDFLVGARWLEQLGVRALADPCMLEFGALRWLLSHGDALCIADHEYIAFRAEVRAPQWQAQFLSRPLLERQALARALRLRSQAAQAQRLMLAEVDGPLVDQWLAKHGAHALVHGHTHRPGTHPLAAKKWRHVLPDWDADLDPSRPVVLRLWRDGRTERLSVEQSTVAPEAPGHASPRE